MDVSSSRAGPQRPIDPADRRVAQEMLAEALSRGLPQNDLAEQREWVAEALGRPVTTVNSISAWLLRYATPLLNELGLEGKLDAKDVAILWHRQLSFSGSEERARLFSEHADRWGTSAEVLESLIARYDAALDKTGSSVDGRWSVREPSEVPVLERAGLAIPVLDFVESGAAAAGNLNAAHVNYDNKAKQEWRKAWFNFLKEKFSPEELKKAKVLCLPSKDPDREVDIYRRLGIPMENIVGVEGGDKEAREEFERNAKALGIRPVLGRLEDVLPGIEGGPFSIVSLDFTGQICRTYLEILEKLSLAPQACVLVNVKGNRESRGIQGRMAGASAAIEMSRNVEPGEDFYAAILGMDDETLKNLSEAGDSVLQNGVSTFRGDGLSATICSSLRVADSHQSHYERRLNALEKTLNEFSEKAGTQQSGNSRLDLMLLLKFLALQTDQALQGLVEDWMLSAVDPYARPFLQKELQVFHRFHSIERLFACRILATGIPSSVQPYSYRSGINQHKSPFESRFIQTQRLPQKSVTSPMQQTATFLLDVVEAMMMKALASPESDLPQVYFMQRGAGRRLDTCAEINGQSIANIETKQLMRGICDMFAWQAKDEPYNALLVPSGSDPQERAVAGAFARQLQELAKKRPLDF